MTSPVIAAERSSLEDTGLAKTAGRSETEKGRKRLKALSIVRGIGFQQNGEGRCAICTRSVPNANDKGPVD